MTDPASAPTSEPTGRASAPRELEAAPRKLRTAALVMALAACLPWAVPGGWDARGVLAKLAILLGGYALYLAATRVQSGRSGKPLALLGWALIVAGLVPWLQEGHAGMQVVERGALAVGVIVWCQVTAYALGGRFNPLLGLALPLFGFAALGRVVVCALNADWDPWALAGSAGILVAAALGGATMVAALKDAKAHGARKKLAAVDARKRARARAGEPPRIAP